MNESVKKINDILIDSRNKTEDFIYDSSEKYLLDPVDTIVDKINDSKVGQVQSIQRKTKLARDLSKSTKTLFKIRRKRREKNKDL